MAGVTLDKITKVYPNGFQAVTELSLELADGEFLVLVGPSGCGKTTALRMIAGLEELSSGRLFVGDRQVNDVQPKDRDIAMVFQNYALYPQMTVAENIGFPLKLAKVPKKERRRQVEAAAKILELTDHLDSKPAQLSGGQRQRVAMGRAIVRKPAVFLMDEPLSNLDAKLRAQTRSELVDLHRRLATTFVYVTHDQAEAMSMATRIAVLDQGRLQQLGDPRNIYHAPANAFVARFIGTPTMNVLAGTVEMGADGTRSVSMAGGRLAIDESWSSLGHGQAVQVGVRPEHLRVGDEGLTITVQSVEWLGHEQILTVETTDATLAIRTSEDASSIDPGATASVTCDAGAVHLFDPDSGERLAQHPS